MFLDVNFRNSKHYRNRYENRLRADDNHIWNRQIILFRADDFTILVGNFHEWNRQSMFHGVGIVTEIESVINIGVLTWTRSTVLR